MNRWTLCLAGLFIMAALAAGCSGTGSPTSPTTNPQLSGAGTTETAQTHLWGYWDLYFDLENGTVEAIPNHQAEFAANVVSFLNSKGGLGFTINSTPVDPGGAFVDVDLDVKLTHPLAGMTQYNGYDVRGIFIGDGTQNLKYDSQLKATNRDNEQYMLDDPDDGDGGGPDGYTRWFNAKEFTVPGLLGYTPGNVATPGYTPLTTLNPYKYFADNLSANDDTWSFLTTTTLHGKFSSGKTNTRNYYLRFPTPLPGVKYAYAVVASWKGESPSDHPANAVEAQAVTVTVTPNIYYTDGTNKGGDFIADISVFDWGSKVSPTGGMEDYILHIETELNTTVYEANASDMTPIGGNADYSTYEIEFTPNNLTFNSVDAGHDAEYWVIVEYPGTDYQYPEPPAPPAPSDKIAAFFRFNDLYIADHPYNADPICDLIVVTEMPAGGWGPVPVEFDATATYDPDLGDILAFEWDFDGDDAYGESPDDDYTGPDNNPTHVYPEAYTGPVNLKVTDDKGGESICSADVEITTETTCGTMTMPQNPGYTFIGSARLYAYNPEGTRASTTSYIIGSPNGSPAYFAAIDPNSTNMPFQGVNNPGYAIVTMSMCSDDKIYYDDGGSTTQLYYMNFSPSTGFSNIRSAFSGGPIPGGSIWRHVVDPDDNPIVFSSNWKVYHWNGSTWGSGITVPASIQSAAGSYNLVWDFDYDPTTGYYYFTERNGNYGIYAMAPDGTLAWSDADVWSGAAPLNWNVGLEFAQDNAECRLFMACGNQNAMGGVFYMARFNPVGGEKVTGTITAMGPYGNIFNLGDGRGTLAKIKQTNNVWRFYCCTFGGNVWGYCTMPAGW